MEFEGNKGLEPPPPPSLPLWLTFLIKLSDLICMAKLTVFGK
jgi:hypothetical protein